MKGGGLGGGGEVNNGGHVDGAYMTHFTKRRGDSGVGANGFQKEMFIK